MAQEYCGALPDDIYNDNCTVEPGKIIAAGYILNSTYDAWTLWTDATEWTTAINLSNGTVIPVYNTRGEYTGPAWEETDEEYGLVDQGVNGSNHEINYFHRGVEVNSGSNIVDYDLFAKSPGSFHFYFVTGNKGLFVTQNPVTVLPNPNVPGKLTERQFWSVVVKSQEFGLIPLKGTAPTITYTAP